MRRRTGIVVGYLFISAILLVLSVRGQNDNAPVLSADDLQNGKSFSLGKLTWKYHSGNGAAWATPDFDDKDWRRLTNEEINTAPAQSFDNWNGQAWFRIKLAVDDRLVNRPLAWRMWHWGASEVYLDGKLLERFGTVSGSDAGDEVERNPRGVPVPFVFERGGDHVFAVRYSFSAASDPSRGFGGWLTRGRFAPGFTASIQSASDAIAINSGNLMGFSGNRLFIGILYSFALLHFLLFGFYPQERTNLFYSLFAFSLANATLSNSVFNGGNQTAFVFALYFIVFAFSYGVAFVSLQAFLYEAFALRLSNFFRWTAALLFVQLIIVLIVLRNRISFYATCVLLFISLADSLRLIVSAVRTRRDGVWIIAGGVMILAAGILMAIGRELSIYINSQWYSDFSDVTLYLGFPLTVSIYLARNFARTNQHLQIQLEQVKEFAEKEVEHERKEARLAAVEAENQRQAKELEEARQLQLSMLPKALPNILNLEIAAYMKPATEVGGDYYDFHVGKDGTLTVAVGDATGHGLKAGTVVTATKSLFNNLADTPNIPDTLRQISRSLKAMNLRGLFMAMTLMKLKDNNLSIGTAGMPSTLIYRAATQTVEEISIRAVPLGGITKFKYQQQNVSLKSGDCVLVMSDGFPEMFNPAGEMLGFEKAAEVLPGVSDKSAAEIIEIFVKIGESWAGARPADDDVTFVVLKVEEPTI